MVLWSPQGKKAAMFLREKAGSPDQLASEWVAVLLAVSSVLVNEQLIRNKLSVHRNTHPATSRVGRSMISVETLSGAWPCISRSRSGSVFAYSVLVNF